MTTPILTTKLYPPPTRPELIPRPRLIVQLSQSLHRKLTLISAPAGFGKTTLVSDWLHQSKVPTVWLSLDKGDNDHTRFLVYLVSALQTIAPHVGEGVLAALHSAPPPPTESILTALLNDITTIPEEFVIVLDDYHAIDAKSVHEALTFLLDYLPAQMHLILTTREDPSLPIARYRVRGQLTELRATDLRFTPVEATEFFNQAMGLDLSTEEIAALETRTEGWIAGLQMAALALQGTLSRHGRADTSTFIQAFTGSHRFVLDYLVEEVLERQPTSIRNFLQETSILDRLSGSLCDAVTGQQDGGGMLNALDRGNLFVVPLDDQRQWYRYHHLFANALQARLMDEQPKLVPTLHQRACTWYAQNDFPSDAIHHAFASGDFEQAASLVELAWPAIFNGFHPATWLGWVQALPDVLVRTRPVLSVGYAWTLLDGGEIEGVESRLNDAQRWVDTHTRPDAHAPELDIAEMVVVNEEEFRTLPATIASGYAYLARARGDLHATVKHARRALDLLPEEDHYWRGIAAMFLGQAYRSSGELEAAYQVVADSVASLQRADHIHFQIVGFVTLADIRMTQGRLREAAHTYEQALQLAKEQGEPMLQETVNHYVGLGELHREWNDLKAATRHLQQGQVLAEQAMLSGSEVHLLVARARIKQSEGDFDGALDLLHAAERQHTRGPVPDLRPLGAYKAQLWLRQGRLTKALEWVGEQSISADDDLSYLHEFEHITLARVLLAEVQHEQGERTIHAAMGLLDRLLHAAQAGGRTGSAIEILVLQALAHQTQGAMAPALGALNRALELGKPEQYRRIFVDEGQPIQTLLSESLAHGADPDYVTQLLTALQQELGNEKSPPDPNQLLIEPLSPRELEVLDLLVAGQTNQAIADALVIALSTVKKHVNNIFGKLGVASRTQAVSRARDLKLYS